MVKGKERGPRGRKKSGLTQRSMPSEKKKKEDFERLSFGRERQSKENDHATVRQNRGGLRNRARAW